MDGDVFPSGPSWAAPAAGPAAVPLADGAAKATRPPRPAPASAAAPIPGRGSNRGTRAADTAHAAAACSSGSPVAGPSPIRLAVASVLDGWNGRTPNGSRVITSSGSH